MTKVYNPHPYAIDSPVVLAPGESTDVKASKDLDAALAAGSVVEFPESKNRKKAED